MNGNVDEILKKKKLKKSKTFENVHTQRKYVNKPHFNTSIDFNATTIQYFFMNLRLFSLY